MPKTRPTAKKRRSDVVRVIQGKEIIENRLPKGGDSK